jgi:hypothetical protein
MFNHFGACRAAIASHQINVAQIFIGVGLIAVPSGLIAGGFTELLQSRRQEKLRKRQVQHALPAPLLCHLQHMCEAKVLR